MCRESKAMECSFFNGTFISLPSAKSQRWIFTKEGAQSLLELITSKKQRFSDKAGWLHIQTHKDSDGIDNIHKVCANSSQTKSQQRGGKVDMISHHYLRGN